MENPQVRVEMLGGFMLYYNDKPILQWQNRGSKTIGFLQYLLYHHGASFRKEELYKLMYGDEENTDPHNTFRVTVHRLRKMLVSAGLPETRQYIVNKNGMCGWNDAVPVEMDTERFRALVERATERGRSSDEALRGCLDAIALYRGEFLPMNATEDWVTVEGTKYKGYYVAAMQTAFAILNERQAYEKVYELASAASRIYPYDERFHIARIDTLLAVRNPKEALRLFDQTVEMYANELGLKPSTEMRALYRRIAAQIPDSAETIDMIKHGLEEDAAADGAFYCNYLTFTESYRYVMRLIERSGQSVFLMLCSLTDMEGNPLRDPARVELASETANEVILKALRRGDMYTCFRPGQFLLLLIGISQEGCAIVSDRIEAQFRKSFAGRGIRLRYKTVSAAGFSPEQMLEPDKETAALTWD